jgi:hypothetical protein
LADKSKRKAIESLADSLRSALLCVASQPTRLFPSPRGQGFYRLEFLPSGASVNLKRARSFERLPFLFSYELSVEPPVGNAHWMNASVVSYWINIGAGAFEYHWHPVGASPVRTPHLHVNPRADSISGAVSLERLHLPTGPVSLAAIVRFLITELGVEPNRADWVRILANVEATA